MTRPARMQVTCTCVICGSQWLGLGSNDNSKCVDCKAASANGRYKSEVIGRSSACLAVKRSVRSGEILPACECKCVDCGNQASDYDHRDYSKPLEVVPVCRTCNLLRGPAKPVDGSIDLLVKAGRVPYGSKVSAIKLLEVLGLDASILSNYPKRLTAAHWAAFWPKAKA